MCLELVKKSLGDSLPWLLDGLKSYVAVVITYNYFIDYIYLSALLCFLGTYFQFG